jgi:acyl-CoA thioesterase YciA
MILSSPPPQFGQRCMSMSNTRLSSRAQLMRPPVSIGDLLSFYARVERVGNTSVTVHVEIYAERNPADLHVVKVTEANLTYVAIDLGGKPRAIPKA